jgi:phosphoenolpyruvate---glycerone phosphotransferase subunit DhaL
MESFPSAQGNFILKALIQTIRDNAGLLSELDGAIGDGDHGVNMGKGFTIAAGRIGDGTDFATGLDVIGDTLLNEIGGAMGPLYGVFFTEMAAAATERTEIDAEVFGAMLEAGLSGVMGLGGAHVGDKTLLDALVPARDAYWQSLLAVEGFSSALRCMAQAAEVGKEATRGLVARVGRASRLGERSRGAVDAGAASCALILSSLAQSIEECLDAEPGAGPAPQ